MNQKRKIKRIKTVEWEEVIKWTCLHCEETNLEYSLLPERGTKVKCRTCKETFKLD